MLEGILKPNGGKSKIFILFKHRLVIVNGGIFENFKFNFFLSTLIFASLAMLTVVKQKQILLLKAFHILKPVQSSKVYMSITHQSWTNKEKFLTIVDN